MGRTLLWHALIALIACTSAEGGVEQALLDWAVTNGGQVHFSIERPCATCERGTVSSHAFAAGDELARIPAAASLPLHGGDSLAEAAFRLLEQLHGNASLRQRYAPFLAAMPAAGEVLALEALPDAELAELQTPALERLARARRREVQAVYSRRKQAAPWLSLPELQHMASLVRTRSFGKLLGRRRLVPALDMLNHAEQDNARVADDGSKFLLLLATRPIAAGEEITLQYKSRVLHRPDASLLLYGFLPPSPDSGAPLLPAVDLPAFMAANPSRPSDTSDDRSVPTTTASWAARLVMLAQYDRLSRALAAMPTSAEQDEALLAPGAELAGGAGGSAAGAAARQRRVLVDFRLRRKRALRAALTRMEAAGSQLSSLCALPDGCAARAARLALAPAGGGSGPASPLEAVLGLLPTALLAPLGSAVLWAWRLRQIGAAALLAQPDILVPLACGAAMLFIARRGGLRMR